MGMPIASPPEKELNFMAERTQPFPTDNRDSNFDRISETNSQVRAEIESFVEGFDIRSVTQRIEEFGRENPIGLALGALAVGVAAGLFMKGKSP